MENTGNNNNNKIMTLVIVLALIVIGGFIYTNASKKASVVTTENTNEEATAVTTASSTLVTVVKNFTVSGSNFKFVPNVISVKKGDTVSITFKNAGGMHDFKIDEFNVATQRLQSGGTETIQFVADKVGSFQYYCSVGTHRAMGMWGTLTVTE